MYSACRRNDGNLVLGIREENWRAADAAERTFKHEA